MKKLILAFAILSSCVYMSAQGKYITKNGHISFFSHTTMEDIKADNNQVASILDSETGEVIFNVLMKSFKFDRALMEEHFNENYVESDKFPKANFKGKVTNISSVDIKKSGTYNVDVEGQMTIHGVTKPVKAKGTLEVKDGNIKANSKFELDYKQFNIVIPSVVKDKFQDAMEITVELDYSPMKK